jgi:hypothetical protein
VRLCNRRGAAAARVACTSNVRRSLETLAPHSRSGTTADSISLSLDVFNYLLFLLMSFTLNMVDLLRWILFVHFSIIYLFVILPLIFSCKITVLAQLSLAIWGFGFEQVWFLLMVSCLFSSFYEYVVNQM